MLTRVLKQAACGLFFVLAGASIVSGASFGVSPVRVTLSDDHSGKHAPHTHHIALQVCITYCVYMSHTRIVGWGSLLFLLRERDVV